MYVDNYKIFYSYQHIIYNTKKGIKIKKVVLVVLSVDIN